MLRADFSSHSVQGAFPAIEPIGPRPDADAAFKAMFAEIRSEVVDFIEHGSTSSGGGVATSLSAAGNLLRARLQPASELAPVAGRGMPDASTTDAFLASIAPYARDAGQRLGVSPDIIAAHAALETGWGRFPLRHPDGSDTNNFFGVKTGRAWNGDAVDARTTEYENGEARASTERFRSFSTPQAAFLDFVRLIQDNPRYHGALNAGNNAQAYAQGLVRGGYATDPAYADKLVRVASRIQSRE